MSTSIHWASEKSGNWSGPSQWRHVTGKQPTTLQTVAVASLPDSGSSSEPPSPSSLRQSIVFLVGRNSRGKWVVQDQRGRCGGLFVGRNEALKFARRENGNRPQAVIMVADTLELDLTPHEVATPIPRSTVGCTIAILSSQTSRTTPCRTPRHLEQIPVRLTHSLLS